ncbi:run domain Beclin-1-interacting and cysteine-rich domain-containing protein [Melanaphis sacchari]|uniref:Run domain Beclin-1 interacting and cystein-rich containing protein n=1 Tax=Melanaphis sacchari TaxID=742174 RepID=A0A2H8TWX6_9HEMI|nr:run domain Beclin-1-interacting and cysteine-rich domain-containing protein [Melanaphis sacchari]XP_025191828.1 run domain Beclin-1-interacting and cysteine-rich domain-containing protein [Melanaphis sacchari]
MEELSAILDNLKSTVECLSMSAQTNTWEVCGGLDRLHSIMMKIFSHGCLTINSNAEDAIWHFIQGINWLHPTIASCTFSRNTCFKNKHLDRSSLWIYKSLENHSLSEKLGLLLSDKDHLYKCYKPEAFLCQKEYSDAALLCLRVVELNQPSLLLEINPKLYLNYSSKNEHCTTLPKSFYKQTQSKYFKQLGSLTNILTYKSSENINEYNMNTGHNNDQPKHKIKHLSKRQCYKSWPDIYKTFDQLKLRQSLSFDTLQTSDYSLDHTHKAATIENTTQVLLPKLLDVNYEQLLNDNENSNKNQTLKNSDLPKRTKRRSKLFTLPLKILEESDDDTRSNISDGSRTLIPYDEFPHSKYVGTFGLVSSYFPDQDLFKFLSSGQFLQANAELDRENAHFKISEAIIGTIEQIKCHQKLKFTDEVIDESDEEINRLKHRIRCRRRQKLQIEQTPMAGTSSSDCLTESTMSSLTSSYCSTTSSVSTADDMDDFELDDDSICSSMFSVCSSSAGSSSYSNIDRTRSASVCSTVTAESVARSLIRQISQKNNWPVNVNVQWLISENDVPQQILPLPSSWPVNPYEPTDDRSDASSRLRGTSDWAPPRPQIIFTSHPSPIRKNIMELQGYRCAGCSMKVAVKYASKFRYCFYLGRYFCTGCHVNKTSIIPGRIIEKWDFSKYPVSCFSFNLLEKMLFDPLFNITDLNSVLYKRARGLDKVRMYRMQLHYIKDFIFLCRYADRLKELLEIIDAHIILKPDLYSIQNLVDVKNGELGKKLQNLIVTCNKHIINCQLCQARGFVCEICNNNKILFPWDFRFVTRCVDCGSCYHKKCYDSRKVPMCPRCPRIMAMFKRTESQNDQNTVVLS